MWNNTDVKQNEICYIKSKVDVTKKIKGLQNSHNESGKSIKKNQQH